MSASDSLPTFESLGLAAPVLQALTEAGYEAPTPIQAQSIPPLLAGLDLLGQAQTGTGKTAAFALPLLSRMDLSRTDTQVLVLAPTRELAIQVAEAFQTYARHLPAFHVLPIYGGQDYGVQLRALKRGAQVVVGTPGRVMDHMRRGTLKLDTLKALVLDEADEMLRMGFIDDVEWILTQTPAERQVALFSATMPDIIRKVAKQHLKSPQEVKIASSTTTAKTIRQRYWQVSGLHKVDALTRLLEVEQFEGMLIFVRTKTATVELAERLTARGYGCEALNGDVPQAQRERVVERLKKGQLDIVVATDVAARGLDVERISHVVNFDIPTDTESYVHRIGRTGRAGRSGEAILFVAYREQHLLRAIERATRQPIEPMRMPTASDVNQSRIARFKQRIADTLASDDLELFERLIGELQQEQAVEPLKIAAALARIVQGDEPFLLPEREPAPAPERAERFERQERPERRDRSERPERPERPRPAPKPVSDRPLPLKDFPDVKMERYRIEVGYQHNVKPGNIVGAIANEAELDARYIGHIEIHDEFTTVDLPDGMPKEVMNELKKARVCGRKIDIKPLRAAGAEAAPEAETARAEAPRAVPERPAKESAPAEQAVRAPAGKARFGTEGGNERAPATQAAKKPAGKERFGSERPAREASGKSRFGDERAAGERPAKPRFGDDRPERPRPSKPEFAKPATGGQYPPKRAAGQSRPERASEKNPFARDRPSKPLPSERRADRDSPARQRAERPEPSKPAKTGPAVEPSEQKRLSINPDRPRTAKKKPAPPAPERKKFIGAEKKKRPPKRTP